MGYIRPDKTLTPGAAAYGRTARWLTGAGLTRCERRQALWQCDLRRGSANASIFWREAGSASVDARTVRGLACLENAEGAPEPLTKALVVGPLPVIATDCDAQWNSAWR